MKNILITTLLVASTLSLSAADNRTREYDGYMKIGFDVSGGKDDTTGSGDTRRGYTRKGGYTLSFGGEERVKDFSFGTRQEMTLYSHGRANYYGANNYRADMSNFGAETTLSLYYKLTQYVKPYLGMGMGINFQDFDDNGKAVDSQNIRATFHGVAGVAGEVVGGFGYFVQYKYRVADNSTYYAPLADGSGTVKVKNKGVSGGVAVAGLSYQFWIQ